MEGQEIGASPVEVYKIQTTVDGGARITLDIPATSADLITKLLQRKLKGQQLAFAAFVEFEHE